MIIPEKTTILNRLFFYAPAILLGGFFYSMVHDSGFAGRIVVLRYFLFGFTGLVAFVLPYISFPEKNSRFIQILNLPATSVFQLYIKRHAAIWGIGSLLVPVIVFGGLPTFSVRIPEVLALLLYGLLFLNGIYLYAAIQYLKTGSDSQQWREGTKGRKTQAWIAETGSVAVDPGSIPSLLLSVTIAVAGMTAVVLGAFMNGIFGIYGELSVSLLLFLYVFLRTLNLRKSADRHFYHSNSFFSEFFGLGKHASEQREPLNVDQLWWIPSRWKVHSWGLILTLDRRLPSGRLVALGHLFIWVLAYQNPDAIVLLSVWGIFAAAHHLLLLLTANDTLLPDWWLRHLDRPAQWMLSRFWVQVRWIVPFMSSIIAMRLLFGVFSWAEIGGLALLYLLTGIIASGLISFKYKLQRVS